MNKVFSRVGMLLVVLIGLGCLMMLIISAYGGNFLRYTGDDFQLKYLTSLGVWGYFHGFLTRINGRFSLAFVGLFIYYLPEFIVRLTPIIFDIMFITGFYRLAKQSTKTNTKWPLLVIGFISAFCLTAISVNTYQTIYWVPSFLSYGLPLGILLFFVTYWVKFLDRKLSWVSLVILFIGALFIGGFHELIAVLGSILLIVILALVIINNVLLKKINLSKDELINKSKLLLVPILGFTTAVIINYLMPGTAYRRLTSYILPERKRDIIRHSWDFSINLFHYTFMQPVVLFCFLATILTALYIYKRKGVKKFVNGLHPFTFYISLFVAFLLPFSFLFITALVSRYFQGIYPPDREYLPFYFCLIMCTVLAGILLAYISSTLTKQAVVATKFSLAIILLAMSPFIFNNYQHKAVLLNSALKIQSIQSDYRDVLIRRDIKLGEQNIHIPFFMTIGDTPYPKPDKDYWANIMMADYYNVDTFSADLKN